MGNGLRNEGSIWKDFMLGVEKHHIAWHSIAY